MSCGELPVTSLRSTDCITALAGLQGDGKRRQRVLVKIIGEQVVPQLQNA